jgi:outer membrane immunogenic protein
VVGYEGDFEWTGVHTTINTGCLACVFSVPSQGVEESVSSRWLSTNRVRLGITNGPGLFYATGGLAVARIEFSDLVLISDLPGPPLANVVTSSNTKVGWTAGGGIEWLLFSNWSVKAEYLYVDLGSVTNVSVNTFNPNPANPTSITHTHNLREQIARVGLNYRFNWGKYPVAARY